jgi:hypothetical protein
VKLKRNHERKRWRSSQYTQEAENKASEEVRSNGIQEKKRHKSEPVDYQKIADALGIDVKFVIESYAEEEALRKSVKPVHWIETPKGPIQFDGTYYWEMRVSSFDGVARPVAILAKEWEEQNKNNDEKMAVQKTLRTRKVKIEQPVEKKKRGRPPKPKEDQKPTVKGVKKK